jgi:hypothetical protein
MITVKIEGKEELLNAFLKSPSVIERNVNEAIRKSVEFIKQNARRKAPVFEGTLKKAIVSKTSRMRGEVGIAEEAEKYGYVREYGRRPGSRMPPPNALKKWARIKLGDEGLAFPVAKSIARKGSLAHPFFEPAIEESMPTITGFFDKAGYKIAEEI